MKVYYLNEEYEAGKHRIAKVWLESLGLALPEDSAQTAINVPYSIIEIDERYNRLLAYRLLRNKRNSSEEDIPDRFYINNDGQIISNDTQQVAIINPNPQKESYKLSQLYGLTQEQLETYIDNNVTTLAQAKTYLKKLSAVVLWLVKQTKLDE